MNVITNINQIATNTIQIIKLSSSSQSLFYKYIFLYFLFDNALEYTYKT